MKRFALALLLLAAPLAAQTVPDVTAPLAPDTKTVVPTIDELHERYNNLVKRVNAQQAPAQPRNFPLLRFKLEQARLFIFDIDSGQAIYPEEDLKRIALLLDRADAVAAAPGDAAIMPGQQQQECAYLAASDGS